MITSTFWATKLRSALIWFSCFCWASAKRRSMPRFSASDLIESVLAVRQADSAPIWEKPTTVFLPDAPAPALAPPPPAGCVVEVVELLSHEASAISASVTRANEMCRMVKVSCYSMGQQVKPVSYTHLRAH